MAVLEAAAKAAYEARYPNAAFPLAWERLPEQHQAAWRRTVEAVAEAIDDQGDLGDCGCGASVGWALTQEVRNA